jgi:hypothetical protein
MEKRGKLWSELSSHTSLEEHGLTTSAIKKWRQREFDAGRPSELKDFYEVHGLCFECRCSGAVMVSWNDDVGAPLWEVCPVCKGTGVIRRPK